ncbi:MAG: penicillin-binding protein activator [Alphaproteobacteria bacterium]|jgi:ABC-type branched-subunit amino acid transport system substrate-binding protein|nr:penicillin-binding protein activator [Alphaproteobacteria bacterium]
MSFILKLSRLFIVTLFAYIFANTSIYLANNQALNTHAQVFIEEELPELSNQHENEIYDDKKNLEDNNYKIGLLLPLSGDAKEVGESMLKAAELSLFRSKNENISLIIEDTKGTSIGTKIATQLAVSKEADIILGPLFSETTAVAKKIAKKNNIRIISFSNNWSLADSNTFLMGFMPYYQIHKILDFAIEKGKKDIAVILPNNTYGDLVDNILDDKNDLNIVKKAVLDDTDNVQDFIKEFSGYNERKDRLDSEIEFYQSYLDELELLEAEIQNKDNVQNMTNEEFFTKYTKYKEIKSSKNILEGKIKELKEQGTEEDLDFNAVLIPFGGDKLREIASLLSYYEVSPKKVKYLGTGLFDDKTLNDEPSLIKSWYATPFSNSLSIFEKNYIKNFNDNPIRISSIAYDAVSLIAELNKIGLKPTYRNLTSRTGFLGIDGVFRFNNSGLIERDLSVMEIRAKRAPKLLK